MLTGAAYGVLQLLIEPYIYFPLQVLVDYPLAFGALGLSGCFSKSKHGLVKGYLCGVLARYVFAVISGWLFLENMRGTVGQRFHIRLYITDVIFLRRRAYSSRFIDSGSLQSDEESEDNSGQLINRIELKIKMS